MKSEEARKVYEQFWDSYLKGDLESFASTLDDDFEMIGTSESEICHSKADGIEFFKGQMEELVGKGDMRNRQIEFLEKDPFILVNESCDIYVLTGSEWHFYSKIRISTWLRETETGWKVTQQHGSLPDMRVGEGETIALEKISKENLELRDAIKRRTAELENKNRELEIESALEKVRTVAMGMKNPDDMLQVCRIIASQLDILGVKHIRNVQTAIIESKEEIYLCYQYFPSYDGDIIERTEYRKNSVEQQMVDQMLAARDSHFLGALTGKELADFRTHRRREKHLDDPLLDEAEELGYCFLSIGEGGLGLTLYRSLDEQTLALFKRFHQVFSLAYQRFRDIQKAEAQAREARIETALELVRSRSLAMHKSDELNEVVKVLFQKLTELQIPSTAVSIQTFREDSRDMRCFVCGDVGTGIVISQYLLPYFDHPIFRDYDEVREKNPELYVGTYSKRVKDSFYDVVLKLPELKDLPTEVEEMIRGSEIYQITMVPAKKSVLAVNDFYGNPLSASQINILKRFSKVFDQTYTRFLDLQKAEAQAREAKIEGALEKVRSRSLAMHKSGELKEVVSVLFEKLKDLQIPFTAVGIATGIEGSKDLNAFVCGQNDAGLVITNYRLSYFDNPVPKDLYGALEKQLDFYVGHYSKDEKDAFYNYVIEHTAEFKHLPEDIKRMIFDSTNYTISMVAVKNAVFNVNDFEGKVLAEEEVEILQRFARVFDQAYTRFLDLQKAEAQAREAKIEAALERVRSLTMAMHSSEDVGKCILKMFSELTHLGVDEGTRFGIGILNHENENNQLWTARKHGVEVNMHIGNINMAWHPMLKKARQAWLEQVPFHKYVLEGEDLLNYYQMLNNAPDYKIQIPLEKLPKKEIQHCFIFEHGFFYAFSSREFQPELIKITQRFSSLFEQTYRRYLDLVKAESQAREAEIELALERVRARTMAMQHSDELAEASEVLDRQVRELGIETWGCAFHIYADDPAGDYEWFSSREGSLPFYKTPRENFFLKFYEKGKAGETFHVEEFLGEDCKVHYDYLMTIPVMGGALRELVASGASLPESQYDHIAFFKNGFLLFITYEPVPESHAIFQRFAKVFEQTYTRFLDLQKAEAQAREAQIEAALEKVRSRSLAMTKSDQLSEVILEIHKKFKELEVSMESRIAIVVVLDSASKDFNQYIASQDVGNIYISTPYFQHPILDDFYEAKEAGVQFFSKAYSEEEKNSYFKRFFETSITSTEIAGLEEQAKWVFAQKFYTHSQAFQKNSCIGMADYSGVPLTEYEIDIIKRFSKVFDQAYTRFLDLQKAEAQTREAQIEAALERVRSRSLAMHKSEELEEVILVVSEQLQQLQFRFHNVSFGLDSEQVGLKFWLATPGLPKPLFINVPYLDNPGFTRPLQARNDGVDFSSDILTREENKQFLQHLLDHSEPGSLNPESKNFLLDSPGFARSQCLMKNTILTIGNYNLIPYSEDENAIFKRFGNVFEQAYTRFLDLQKAEAQAHEAKVEAALEKVRSRTMGMQSSEELPEVANLLFLEVQGLGVPAWSSGFNIIAQDGKSAAAWMSSEGVLQEPFKLRLFGESSFDEMGAFIQSTDTFMVQELGGNALIQHYDHMKSFPDLKPTFSAIEAQGLSLPTYQINHLCKFSHGFLLFITYEPVPNAHDIFRRFTNVFDQTYTRFLDLKKAEAQAKEARIEAALERVRSRTMGMQKAEELGEVATVLFSELNILVDNLWTCGFVLCEKDRKEDEWWLSLDNGLIQPFSLPNVGDFAHESLYEGWEKGEAYRTVTLEAEKLQEHYDWLMSIPIAQQIFEDMEGSGIPRPNWQRLHAAYFKTGYLVIITEIPCEEEEIFKRFAQVFDLTYTRFLDLKKAEAQAREARIELSLQRIRAQVTAMRNSDELFDIVVAMRKEFISLGHEADYFWHMKWTSENYDMSMTSEDGERVGMIISIPKFVHDKIPRLATWERGNSPTIALDLNGPEAWDYIANMNSYGKYEQADPHAPTEEDILAIGGLTFVIARTTHGEIGFSLPGQVPNPPEESVETLVRFASVFDLAYRRFEDLLTAEKQNRKAKIELALERVRARAMAMQEPEELIQVAQVMREEMGLLGVEELETSSIYINQPETDMAQCWYSLKDIRDGAKTYVADHFDLNYQDTYVGRQMLDFYQGEQMKISIPMQGENRKEWINYCASQSPKLDGYYGTEIPERIYHLTKFSHGAIGAATPGEISSESWDLLRRAALVFSLAYARFKDLSQARDDLKRLKKAKSKAESALKELKAAQEQLVQQEKLASLGQLTAGIAHEIKNPLNFVNNFSDLSRELIEEVFEELEHIESSEAKEEIIAILNDVKSNLTKVHEHGSRADSIVTSMLQHSRASGSKREPKAFNPLVQEFVNLSYHGMRAGKAPINVQIDLQLDPKVGEVSLISEDFSRVILNLCNNAFDAMRDKLKTGDGRRETEDGNSYLPKLTVKTSLQKDKVMLSIGDNGGGIPEEIRDKILQPFFTTKKGTDGTGLGLSITHDIIKAHGGELKVESTKGEGSVFSIQLPLV